jgi:L-asparaginase II
MSPGCEVSVVRGGLVESVHDVAVAVVAPGGAVAAETPGAATLPVFLRSAAKPFQAEPAVRAGVLERLGLDDRHLALACASHLGEEQHVVLAAGILAAAGLEVGALECGSEDGRSPLHHMCSGNHALGLALCACEGWPTAGYLEPGHPLQVAMRDAVRSAAGVAPEEAVDGCGMRAYRLPLHRYAALFGALGSATGALGRCADAMRAFPDVVRGAGEIDTELMRAEAGLVAKVGAEATIGLGLPDGRGLALKVRDGAWRAMEPAAVHAARAGLGLRADGDGLTRHATPPIMNARGEEVGSLVIRIALMGETT